MKIINKVIKRIKRKIKKPINKLHKYLTIKVIYPQIYKKNAKQPVDERKIVFIEMRYPYLSDSFHLIYERIKQNYDMEMKAHFMLITDSSRREKYIASKALVADMATAKYVFITDGSGLLGSLAIRPETQVIQLWHACGAFKRFGKSTAELIFGASAKEQEKYPTHKNYTLVPVSSPEVVWAYEEAMGLEKGIAKALGTSRTDVFYDDEVIKKAKDKLSKIMPESIGKKVILYAPTFRGRVARAKTSHELDTALFKKMFSDEYVLLTKHHPLVKKLPEILPEDASFVRDITKEFTIEEALCVADICISDYSSIIFEYSLFERPMMFFAYDIEEFNDWRGFYYDYEELTPGPIFTTNMEMVNYIKHIKEKFDKNEVIEFKEKFMSACDGQATKRIVNEVFGDSIKRYERETPLAKTAYSFPTVARPFGERETLTNEAKIDKIS